MRATTLSEKYDGVASKCESLVQDVKDAMI